MKLSCSGIILSGGLNSRMGGKNKAFLSLGGQTILDRLCRIFQSLFNDVLLVTRDPLSYLSWDLMIATDLFEVRSALTGIHAGLFHTSGSHAFIAACDTPFLKPGLIQVLLDELEPKWDVIIPVTAQGNQPLCAIYSKRCIMPIERQLTKGDPKISNFFPDVRVKEIPEAQLRSADPDLVSFFNINTPEDFATSQKWLQDLI